MINKLVFFTILFLAIFPFVTLSANESNRQVRKEIKPNWVTELQPGIKNLELSKNTSGGSYDLLSDIQDNLATYTSYYHFAFKLLNSEGVQNMSDINVDFDPSFQKLTFHEINIYRNGSKTNVLNKYEIKTIQRETDMDRFLYDGSLTAFINLKDIREGDIIEYSYSLQGFNPVNKGNYSRHFYFEFNSPIKELNYRIISPESKELNFNYPFGKVEPLIHKANRSVEYVWHKKDLPALIYDINVPAWYDNSSQVQVSSYKSWSEVISLSLENYTIPEKELSKLKHKTDTLFQIQNVDSMIVSIIRFVQDKIRYLAFESGMNAYKPVSPSLVIESRYGDCKAKSLLLCSLLRLKGIEAYPVLVNSNQIKPGESVLPSLNVFNHVVVQIIFGNKIYYIDPTISNQGGTLGNIYFPYYGSGLVIKEGTRELSILTNRPKSETRVKNFITLNEIGGPATFKVVTEYFGKNADIQRSSYHSKSGDEIAKDYLNYYSKTYPQIHSIGTIVFHDNRSANVFEEEEKYIIDSIWAPTEENAKKLGLTIYALGTIGAIKIPASPERKMPFFLGFPTNYLEDTYIDLPQEWNFSPVEREIQDSVFRFTYSSSYEYKKIHLAYVFRGFKDFVPANSFKAFYTKHQKIYDYLSYSMTYTKNVEGTSKFSWFIGLLYVIITAISIWYARKIYLNYSLENRGIGSIPIGGWLILVAIGLGLSTIILFKQFMFDSKLFNPSTWQVSLESSTRNIPLFVLIVFEFIYNCVILVYLVLLQILFYKRRNVVPILFIIYLIVNLLVRILDTILANTFSMGNSTLGHDDKEFYEIARTFIYATIWILYFLNSTRVRATFNEDPPNKNKYVMYSNPVFVDSDTSKQSH